MHPHDHHEAGHDHDHDHAPDGNTNQQPGPTWRERAPGLAYTALYLTATEAVLIPLTQGAPEGIVVAAQATVLGLGALVLLVTTD